MREMLRSPPPDGDAARGIVLWTFGVTAVVFVAMILEAGRSRRNESRLRSGGAVEPSGDVYSLMQVVYPACFLAMIAEGAARQEAPGLWTVIGAATFAASKALKYWAISTLGWRWTFRVLVPPGAALISTGPYRWMRHPNYLAVAGELAGVAMLAGAQVTGVVSFVVFGGLLLARIRVEERAHGDL
jgi:methyltransferase